MSDKVLLSFVDSIYLMQALAIRFFFLRLVIQVRVVLLVVVILMLWIDHTVRK